MENVYEHKLFLYELAKGGTKRTLKQATSNEIGVILEVLTSLLHGSFHLSSHETKLVDRYSDLIQLIVTSKGAHVRKRNLLLKYAKKLLAVLRILLPIVLMFICDNDRSTD
jgi:hypothetical protein